MTRANVYVHRADYDESSLKPAIYGILDASVGGKIKNGTRVLVKPNLAGPTKPSRAITVHPAVVRCVCQYVLERGAKVRISDSPAIGGFETAIKAGGYKKYLATFSPGCSSGFAGP